MFRILFDFPFVSGLVWRSAHRRSRGTTPARAMFRVFAGLIMNDGDQVVLACLKQHRARISKACDKVLTDNGQ